MKTSKQHLTMPGVGNRLDQLAAYFTDHEEWLMEKILDYAVRNDYARYTSTLKEAWRASIAGLTASICQALADWPRISDFGPDEAWEEDGCARFGILQAQRHRSRGVTLGMFLGLMKYYRQAYVDLLHEHPCPGVELKHSEQFVQRVFDRMEIGFCSEWAKVGQADALAQLQQQNRQLSNQKNYYLTIFESARIPCLLLDGQGQLTNLNHAAAKLFGLQQLPGSFYYGSDVAVDLGWLQSELERFIAADILDNKFEQSLGPAVCEVHLQRMLDVSGKFSGVVVSLYDVTAQKQTARELVEMNLALNLMTEVSRTIARSQSREEVLAQFCLLVEGFTGFDAAWFVDEQHDRQIYGSAGALPALGEFPKVLTGELQGWVCYAPSWEAPEGRTLALPIRCGDCRLGTLWLGLNSTAEITEKDLQLYENLCSDLAHGLDRFRLQDEQRRISEALLASEERFSQFVENAPQAIQEIDCLGMIELVNPALEQLYGRPREDLLDHTIFEFIPEEEQARVREALQEMCRFRPAPTPYSNRILDAQGRLRDVEVSWNYRYDGQGELTGFRAIITDVSERNRVAEELEAFTSQLETNHAELTAKSEALVKAHEDLKQAQSQMLQNEKMASIGQLAAGVAHEINNPLGFISSNLTNLGRYCERLAGFIGDQSALLATHPDQGALAGLADGRRQYKIDYLLEDIPDLIAESLDGAQRVKEIVQNLKTFSRVDENDSRPADINQCLESTIHIVWNEIKYKATLERDYGELPILRCQPQQLNQVFMNLLVNAAQAIESKGEIRVSTRRDEDAVLVTIADSGCGMSEEVKNRIFEPFYTTKPVGQGTGLGMSIVYDIIKRHGGEISIESAPGQGSSFMIRLPLEGESPEVGGGEGHVLSK